MREEWLKGRAKTGYAFPNNMCLDCSFELALTSLDLNAHALELITFDNSDPLLIELNSATKFNNFHPRVCCSIPKNQGYLWHGPLIKHSNKPV